VQPKICSSSSKAFRQSASDIIADFWQSNSTVECLWDGLPLYTEWQDWSKVAQPSSISATTSPQDSFLDARDDTLDFWLTADALVEDYKMVWDWTLYVALGANVGLALLGFGIMWSTAMSDGPQARRFLNAPFCWCTSRALSVFFWVLFATAWAFGLWFSTQTVLTIDTCTTDVSDAVPLELLKRFQSQHPESAPLLSYSRDMLQECSVTSENSMLEDLITQPWDSLMQSTLTLSLALQSLPPNIYFDICGVAVWPLQDATLKLQKELCDLQQAWKDIETDILNCEQWLPDYALLKDDAICSKGSKTLLWLTVTQLLILVMAMLVWTFRRGTFL
jgi:hypothetical protein